MEYYDFNFVLDLCNKRKQKGKTPEYDLGKAREKFTEIVDAVGVDSHLLKQYRDEQSGRMVKFGRGKPQFCFPETICDFCAELILRYTSADFKKVRTAEFTSVDPEASLFLMDGFTNYLHALGHDTRTIVLERHRMDSRLHYHTNIVKAELNRACGKLADSAKKYEQFLDYEDSVHFIRHMVMQVNHLQDMIDSIFSEYEDARRDEISGVAMLISENIDETVVSEDVYRSSVLADALKQDQEYQSRLTRLHEILIEPGFKQSTKGRYNRIMSELSSIRRNHEMELFGESTPDIPVTRLRLKHPMDVLQAAIMSVSENEHNRIEHEEKEANLTEKQIQRKEDGIRILREFYEKRGVSFDLPCIDSEEEELFANALPDHEVKGNITFSCCETEKIVVYKGSTGCCAIKCPQCGQISVFDFDKMISKTVSRIRHPKASEP